MPLIFDLVSKEQLSPSLKSSVTFRDAGGTIGRAETATWKLTDRSRHISGVHAEVSYDNGVYYLTDRSTNGTFDAGKNARLQKNEDYPIAHGDSFRMGNFIFKARIIQDAEQFTHQHFGESASISGLIPDDEFLAVDPISLLESPPNDDQFLSSFSASDDERMAFDESLYDLNEPFQSPTLVADTTDQSPDFLTELAITDPVPLRPVPVKTASKSLTTAHTNVEANADSSRLLMLLGQALDFDFNKLTPAETEFAIQNLGALAKQSIQGLQQVLRTRAEIKNKLRLGNTMLQESGNNPLKLSGNYAQTLDNLLLAQSGYLAGPQAIRQALKDLQAHQVASFAASRTSLDSAFEQFSPTQLIYRFETSGQHNKWGNKQAYYWQQYQLHHQKMAADQEWRHSQFTHDYARVYEEQAQYIHAAWSEFDAR
ncbi:MAG: type VI secretion system-associated FHA domain protein TagH [Tolumonas sp.]|nr:type VI secretion system-associated FHA domain protein TagH [Tolumonas sp.]